MYKLEDLNKKKVSDLKEIAKELNIPKVEKLLKSVGVKAQARV